MWTSVWLAACSGGEVLDSDSGGADVPTGETIRVVTYDTEAPIAGAEVLISAADGAVVDVLITDLAGEVHTELPDGGSASILDDVGTRYVRTTFDVPPGGTAVLASTRFLGGAATTAPVGPVYTITASALSSPVGATEWEFLSRCDSVVSANAGPIVLDNVACPNEPTDQVLAIAFDAAGSIVGWGAAFDAPLTGNLALPVAMSEVALTRVGVEVVNVPTTATLVAAALAPIREGWRLYSAATTQPSGDLSAALEVPALPVDRYLSYGFAVLPDDSGVYFLDARSVAAGVLTFDVESIARPLVDAPDVADPLGPVVSWQVSGARLGDVGLARVINSTAGEVTRWEARFDPAARFSVQLPALPEAWAYAWPHPEVVSGATVTLQDLDVLDGWSEGAAWSGALPDEVSYTAAVASNPATVTP